MAQIEASENRSDLSWGMCGRCAWQFMREDIINDLTTDQRKEGPVNCDY